MSLSKDNAPYPIARLLADYGAETNPNRRLRALIRAFAGLLKYLGLIAISDYLNGTRDHPEINKLLTGKELERPSLGHWNHFLRQILLHFQKRGETPFVPPLMDFYFRASRGGAKVTRNVALIDDLIGLRNEIVHPDVEPPEEKILPYLQRYGPVFAQFFDACGFLADFPLILQTDGERRRCVGHDPSAFPVLSTSGEDGFFIEGPAGFLRLFDFLLCCRSPGEGSTLSGVYDEEDTLLYETSLKKKTKFLRGNAFAYHERQGGLQGFARVLAELREELGKEDLGSEAFVASNTEQPDWGRLYRSARKKTKAINNLHIAERKYSPVFYVHREGPEKAFFNFLKATQPHMILVGDSGSGKTNLLCHLSERAIDRCHLVLHFYARNFPSDAFQDHLAHTLVMDPGQLLPYIRALDQTNEARAGKRILLLVDALNEYPNPENLYRAIRRFIEDLKGEGIRSCKTIITTRPLTWRQLELARDISFPKDDVFRPCPDEEGDNPALFLHKFNDSEARQAYDRYTDNSSEESRSWRERFYFRLETPYDALPREVRKLLTNPLFLALFARAYESIPSGAGALDAFLAYYDRIDRRHRYCLQYFVQALWDHSTDALTDDQILQGQEEGAPPFLAKLAEYFEENPYKELKARHLCLSGLQKCACSGQALSPDQIEETPESGLICRGCDEPVNTRYEVVQQSTLYYLEDEGILSLYESSGSTPSPTKILRFTYDRFFEMQMAKYLLQIWCVQAYSLKTILQWFETTRQSSIYDNVLTLVLSLHFSHRPSPDEGDSHGILVALQKRRRDEINPEGWSATLISLLEEGHPRWGLIVREALVQSQGVTQGDSRQRPIHRVLLLLAQAAEDKKRPVDVRLAIARTLLNAARRIGFYEAILRMGANKDANIRLLACCETYFLWRENEDAGLSIMQAAYGKMFRLGFIPKPELTEFAIGSALITAMGHPESRKTMDLIAEKGRDLLKRNRLMVPLLNLAIPPLINNVLKDVPNDYNPVNLEELKAEFSTIARDQKLRESCLRVCRRLYQERIDLAEHLDDCRYFMNLHPDKDFPVLPHQLLLQRLAASDPNEALAFILDIGWHSFERGGVWLSGTYFDQISVAIYHNRSISEENFARLLGFWDEVYRQDEFSFRCMADTTYLNWQVSACALPLALRTGDARVPFIEEKLDGLLIDETNIGLRAFLRGLNIMGPELGASHPLAVKVTLNLISRILDRRPEWFRSPIHENWCPAIAATLRRMESLFPDEVGVFFDSIEQTPVREALRLEMRRTILNENLGIWASQRGQEFYAWAMGQPYWQRFFGELFEAAFQAPSFGKGVRRALNVVLGRLSEKA